MTTQNYNRATAIGATLVFLVLSLLVADYSTPKRSDPIAQRPSTFFTDPSGARALLLVMRRLLPLAETWRRPLYRLASDGPGNASSLIVADPKLPLGKKELAALERWLNDGGQLILLSRDGWPLGGRVSDENVPAVPSNRAADDAQEGDREFAKKDEPEETVVTFLSRHAPDLRWAKPANFKVEPASGSSIPAGDVKLRWRRSFSSAPGANAVATAGKEILAVEIPVGQGRIIAVADPAMASNGSLRRSDNAVWLVNLVAGWGDGSVLFDEFHHGFGDKPSTATLARAFSTTPWGWCLGQIAIAGLLYIFCYRRRFGRISEPPAAERSSPLDQVDARAGILRAAGAQRLATQLIMQNLFQELSLAHGRTIDIANLDAQAARKLQSQIAPQSVGELRALAAKADRGAKLTEREFVAIGRLAGMILSHHRAHRDPRGPIA
jgi:hypothetical protein